MYEIETERTGRFIISADGVYQTNDGDNAPISAVIAHNGGLTTISVDTVEIVGGVDMAELDARYAPVAHSHDGILLTSGSGLEITSIVTYALPLVVPVSLRGFRVTRVSSGFVDSCGVDGLLFGLRYESGKFATYGGSWSVSPEGVLSVTCPGILVSYIGQYFWQLFY